MAKVSSLPHPPDAYKAAESNNRPLVVDGVRLYESWLLDTSEPFNPIANQIDPKELGAFDGH